MRRPLTDVLFTHRLEQQERERQERERQEQERQERERLERERQAAAGEELCVCSLFTGQQYDHVSVCVYISSSSLPSELQLSLQKMCRKPLCFCVHTVQNYDMK